MPSIRFAATLLALALSGAALAESPAADTADARFRALYEREWDWRQREYPQFATYTGNHRGDGELGHVDEASQQRRLKDLEAFQRELEAIAPDRLSPQGQVDYAIYREQLANAIGGIRVRGYLLPMTSDSSFYADLIQMPESQPLETRADYDNYLKRLAAIPAYFDEHIALLKQGVKTGMTLPQVVLQGREGPLRNIAEGTDLQQNPFYAPFKKFPAAIGADDAAALRRDGEKVIREQVVPAYAKLLKYFVGEYVPKARKTLGAYSLPNGVSALVSCAGLGAAA